MSRSNARWTRVVAAAAMLGACTAGLSGCSGGGPGGSGTGGDVDPVDGGSGTAGTAAGGSATGGPGDGGSGSGGSATGGSGSGSATGGTGGTGGQACGQRVEHLEVQKPNVFFVLDRSSSMEGQKLADAKAGLNQIADSIADEVRVGVSGFPIKSCCCSSRRLLEMGPHTSAEIKKAWADLTAAGGTPTGQALYHVNEQGWVSEDIDAKDDKRPKAVILITDGEPNDEEICPEDAKDSVREAYRLYDDGRPGSVKVHVVGFATEGDTDKLNLLAESGGTDAPGQDRFWKTSDAGELVDAIETITRDDLPCTHRLRPEAPEGSTLEVSIAGKSVSEGAENGFSFDEQAQEVVLKGSACEKLRSEASEGTTLEIQVGCPGCKETGASCQVGDDCCSGACRDNTCVELCRTDGESCDGAGDCCGNAQCARDGDELVGACRGR